MLFKTHSCNCLFGQKLPRMSERTISDTNIGQSKANIKYEGETKHGKQ